jgi:diacylglycerol O-acyltransferase
MPDLSVIDLAMFLLETPERPYNIGPLAIIAPPANFRGNFADKLLERMLERSVGAPFNYRLGRSAAGIPKLDIADQADARKHVQRLTLEAPASMEQLCATVSKLHEVRIDRSGLLWELYVIDGLEGGKVALYGKVHHAIIDGRTFVQVVSNWFVASASDKTVRALWEGVPQVPRKAPAKRSLAEFVGGTIRQTAATTASALGLYKLLARQALATVGVDSALTVPVLGVPKVFQGKAVAGREFGFCTLPIAEVKAVAKAQSGSVNDVFLAVVDAAMARLLVDSNALPAEPLVADMPLALNDAKGGNQIAVLQFPLGAPQMNVLERLAAIRTQAGRVKDLLKHESASTLMLYTTLVHGVPALLEKMGLRESMRVSNVLISNPFGLMEERYLMGGRVELALPMAVVAAGQMLNVTAVTAADKFQIGFLAVAKAVPQFGKLAGYTLEAFEELKQAGLPPVKKAPRGASHLPKPAASAKPRPRASTKPRARKSA